MSTLTIILPVFNGANFIAESIASVLAQDFGDFVLHVLDDCSTDNTAAIVAAVHDRRVRYTRNDRNRGLFYTLNRGCREANTEWVRIWAHDDRMLPGSLGEFMTFAKAHRKAGMIFCDFHEIDEAGARTGGDLVHQPARDRTPDLASGQLVALLFLTFGCLPGNVSTVMLRRDVWADVCGFQEGIQQAPDYEMWVRLAKRYPIGFLRAKTVEVRTHLGQLSHVGMKKMTTVEEELLVLETLARRLEGVVPSQAIRAFWRQQRGRQHAHWLAKALFRQDWAAASRGWRALGQYGQRGRQMLRWLMSGNGRWFTPRPEAFFDMNCTQCSNRGKEMELHV